MSDGQAQDGSLVDFRDSVAAPDVPDWPDQTFDVIYADPPWRYDRNSARPSDQVENHYPTMDLDAIKTLDPPAGDDCILYLWATAPKTGEAVDVLRAWGFDYKTNAVWDKKRLGLGYWFRVEHELLFVGTRGDVSPPDEDARRGSIFHEERGEHSEKPACVRAHIEDAHPDADKLELFSRDGRVGWTMWGNEADNDTPQATFDHIADRARSRTDEGDVDG